MTSFKDLLSQRLRKLFDEKDIVKAHFAKKIDKKHENIQRWLRGDHTPDAEALGKIAQVLPFLNLRWLLTGVGDMEETFTSPMREAAKRYQENRGEAGYPHAGPEVEALVKFEFHEKDLNEVYQFSQALKTRKIEGEEFDGLVGKLLYLQLKRRHKVMNLRLSFDYEPTGGHFNINENPENFFDGNLDILIEQKNHISHNYIDEYLALEEKIMSYIGKYAANKVS